MLKCLSRLRVRTNNFIKLSNDLESTLNTVSRLVYNGAILIHRCEHATDNSNFKDWLLLIHGIYALNVALRNPPIYYVITAISILLVTMLCKKSTSVDSWHLCFNCGFKKHTYIITWTQLFRSYSWQSLTIVVYGSIQKIDMPQLNKTPFSSMAVYLYC